MKPKSFAKFVAWNFLGAALAGGGLMAEEATVPPMITRVMPVGVRRGATVEVTLEGRNLSNIRRVLFDKPGLSARFVSVSSLPEDPVDPKSTAAVVPLGLKQQATIEITASNDAETGISWFRVDTPLGTSNMKPFDVGSLEEVHAVEHPMEQGNWSHLPATLVGNLGWPGATDRFGFEARAGEELVFQTVAATLGSELRAVLAVEDSQGKEVARAGDFSRRLDSVLVFKVPADGKYSLTVSDIARAGGRNHFYRIHAGALPYVESVFPLGVRAGASEEVSVKGAGLGGVKTVRVEAPASAESGQTIPLRVKTPMGAALNELRLAVGPEPEVAEAEDNNSAASAQPITLPVAVNGRIQGTHEGKPDEDFFRFNLHKGEHVVAEVMASRLGSKLDSVLEILDEQGRTIRTGTARCVLETPSTLSDRDSRNRGYRFTSTAGFQEGDYVWVDDELNRIAFMPGQPDEDIILHNFGGTRMAEMNTSPQGHPTNSHIYKVELHGPDATFPPNGLPVFYLTARNDDGGPGFEADSRLDFTAPRDGEYRLRVNDANGLQGEDFAYRMTLRLEEKDFMLTASPANPNVPRGGRVPVEVTANRVRGYQGPIEVELKGLPNGLKAERSTIPAGQDSTVVVVESADDPKLEEITPAPIEVVGRGFSDGAKLLRVADAEMPLRVVSVMPPPDIVVTAEPREVTIEPGGTAEFTFHVERKNNFTGRVPCNALALPPGVTIDNTGLNGVLVVQGKTSRTVKLTAADWAPSTEQPFYVVAQVESNSTTTHAAAPFLIHVKAKTLSADAARK
jgi:phosphotransferase system HPr-like phosphotransfer protein